MTKLNLQSALRRIVVALLSIMMVISAIPMNAYAADDGEKIIFTWDDDGDMWSRNDHYVLIGDEPWTIYCMQADRAWPKYLGAGNDTEFTMATDETSLINPEQAEIMRRALYAGYPYNGAGIFDERVHNYIIEEYGYDSAYFFKEECTRLTAAAVWLLAAEMDVPNNTKVDQSQSDIEGTEKIIINEIIDFAKAKTPNLDEPSSSEIVIKGEKTFKEQEDGTWKAGPLYIEDPDDRQLWHDISVPEGIYIVDENNDESFWEGVFTGNEFYLTCDSRESIGDGFTIEATATVRYPDDVAHFVTNSKVYSSVPIAGLPNPDDYKVTLPTGGPGYAYPAQNMIGVKVQKFILSGELTLKADDVETSSLEIEKEFADDIASKVAGDMKFAFNVTLADQTNKTYDVKIVDLDEDGNITRTIDSTFTTDDNCTGTVEITGSQRAVIEGIPCDTEYTVSENVPQDANGTWNPDKTSISGTIALDEVNLAEIKNSYTYDSVTSDVLTAQKNLKGDGNPGVKANDYSFVLVPENENNPMPNVDGVQEDDHGWPYLVKQNNDNGFVSFGTFTFNEPGEYKYTVTEEDVTVPNTSRDSAEYEVTYNVAPNNDGKLEVSKSVTGGTTENIVFTNEYTQGEVTQDFSAVKRIEDTTDTTGTNTKRALDGYEFKIYPAVDGPAAEMYPDFEGTTSPEFTMESDEDGIANSASIRFTEKWFDEIAKGAKQVQLSYIIEELESDVDGIVNDEDSTREAIITVTRNEENGEVELTSTVEYRNNSDDEWTHEAPVFVNKYEADVDINLNGMGDFAINVDKQFEGSAYTPAEGEQYTFSVTPVGSDEEAREITLTWTKKDDGSFGWVQDGDTLTFNRVGTYDYQIAEVDPQIEGMSCDSLVWGVRFHVTESETAGKLETTTVYNQEDSTETNTSGATFTNKYETSVDTEFDITKQLIGDDWTDSEAFRFSVDAAYYADADTEFDADDVAATSDHVKWNSHVTVGHEARNEGSAKVEATMDAPGVYYFAVNEVPTQSVLSDAISFDDSTYVAKVVVTRKGNKLVATDPVITKNGDVTTGIKFVNYVSRIEITKQVSDPANVVNYDATYDIKVSLADGKTVTCMAKNGDNAERVEFVDGEHVFTLKAGDVVTLIGLPVGTEYTVEELLTEEQNKVFVPSISIYDDTSEIVPEEEGVPEATATIGYQEQHYVYVKNSTFMTNLIIEKKVVDETGTIDVDNEKFEFEITAKTGPFNFFVDRNFEGSFMTKSSLDPDGQLGEVTFEDGKATVTVAHNESLEILQLVAGTDYEVVEKNPGKYHTEIKVSKKDGGYDPSIVPTALTPIDEAIEGTKATGELEAGKIDTVSFTNTMIKKQDKDDDDDDDFDDNEDGDEEDDDECGVDTGDHAPLTAMIVVCIAAVGALLALVFLRKKTAR